MAGENTVSTMEMYKEQYGETLNSVVPTSAVLYDLTELEEDLGDSFRQSVILTNEHGATYNGSGGGVVTLNAPKEAVIKESNHTGFEIIMRSRITYAAASRGQSSKQAFKKTWDTVLMNLRKASVKRLEMNLLTGQDGIGEVSSLSSETVTLKNPEGLSPSVLAGLEGAKLEAWTSRAATATEHGVTTGSTVSSVSIASGTITSGSGEFSGGTPVAADDFLYFFGARTSTGYNEAPGLRKMAANSGTLFGINSSDYNLWAGNEKTSFGVPSMGKFLDAITQLVEKGLDEDVCLLLPPKAWEVLNADLAAQRQFDGSYSRSKAKNGAHAIEYYGQMGSVEVRVHPFLFRGEALIFPKKGCLKRVGSADLGMGVPGTDGREVFFHLPDNNAVEARTYSDQALFCDAPSKLMLIRGITYP